MTLKALLVLLGGVGVVALTGPVAAEEARGARPVTTAEATKVYAYRKKRPPMEIDIYAPRRRGGYSYGAQDVTSSYDRRNPPPYMHVRQTPSGPFDSGFFFDSGFGRNAGDAPYPH